MTTVATQRDTVSAAHDRVFRALRTRIMHGDIAPGQALTLRGIGKEYDVSMTPAREAVRRLVAEGALTLSQSGRVSTPELSNERIEELAALRALIEVELATRALPRAHLALIERLQTINTAVAEAVAHRDAVSYIRTNLEFHRTLYLRAQAPAMQALTEHGVLAASRGRLTCRRSSGRRGRRLRWRGRWRGRLALRRGRRLRWQLLPEYRALFVVRRHIAYRSSGMAHNSNSSPGHAPAKCMPMAGATEKSRHSGLCLSTMK